MGLILYCGIRHERNVEKARDYLDGDTIEFLERALKHPDLVKPYGRILYGDSSRYLERYGREVYLVGCLKAGGLLKDVPGTAEDWLKKVISTARPMLFCGGWNANRHGSPPVRQVLLCTVG